MSLRNLASAHQLWGEFSSSGRPCPCSSQVPGECRELQALMDNEAREFVGLPARPLDGRDPRLAHDPRPAEPKGAAASDGLTARINARRAQLDEPERERAGREDA